MPVYHIVLFKLKPGVTPEKLTELSTLAKALVGQIPGLISIEVGPPHASTAQRAQGYDMGLVAVLDKPETIPVYAGHDAHLKLHKFREEVCEPTLAYDLEF